MGAVLAVALVVVAVVAGVVIVVLTRRLAGQRAVAVAAQQLADQRTDEVTQANEARAEANAAREAADRERDVARVERDAAQGERDAAQTERDEARAVRDDAAAQRDAAGAAADEARAAAAEAHARATADGERASELGAALAAAHRDADAARRLATEARAELTAALASSSGSGESEPSTPANPDGGSGAAVDVSPSGGGAAPEGAVRAPLDIAVLWALERLRSERTWRMSVAVGPDATSGLHAAPVPLVEALQVEVDALREDVGADVELEVDLPAPVGDATSVLALRVGQELLAGMVRASEVTTMTVRADGSDLVITIAGVDADGAPVTAPSLDLPPSDVVRIELGGVRLVGALADG